MTVAGNRLESWSLRLYLLNFSLLFAHQIDSAYWHEWRLFHLPGGIQLFVLLNLVLLLAGLAGLVALVRERRAGHWMALFLAAAGLFAFTFHAVGLAGGGREFRLPVSIGILVATLLVSLAQAGISYLCLRRSPE